MKYFLAFIATAFFISANAQVATVSGKVTDNVAKQPVVGAKIFLTPSLRAISDYDGNYVIKDVPYGDYDMTIIMISFDTMHVNLKVDQDNVTYDVLLGGSQDLEEVEVIGNLAKDRETPVAVSTISTREINEELGSQDLPMILNSKPGVYATQQGGGDGDARITIRGFDQRNVGVMIDGVPVNDMENGWVYWSNWFGLDAITSQIQVQRGLGATKLAMPSVGGTMNILTQNTGGKREIKFLQEYGTGNFFRTSFSYKSGTLPKGWGILFSGSYKQGLGWVDALNTQGGFYYLKIQKKWGNHVTSLSGFGAPQQHGQRSFSQPISYWDAKYGRDLFKGSDELYKVLDDFYHSSGTAADSAIYIQGLSDNGLDEKGAREYWSNYVDTVGALDRGVRYNQHWGYITDSTTGKRTVLNERRNFYHKPQITLKDFWKINKKLSWSNMAYVSIGRGGGQRYANSSSTIIYDSTNQIDWDQIVYNNQNSFFGGPNTDPAYSPTLLKSNQILSASMNNHLWIGGLSQFDYSLGDYWKLAGGLDYRWYKGEHFTQVMDLLGGDYFINLANKNADSPMKGVGDKIAGQSYQNHRDGFVQWAGGFAQAEYSKGRWTAFVNASTVTNFYKGVDYFRQKQLHLGDTTLLIGYEDTVTYNGVTYDRNSDGLVDNQTDWVRKTGATVKVGANMNINEKMNVFLNAGYLSRTPQFSNVIDNTANRVFDDLVNENIMALEIGYGFRSKKFSGNLNGYYTRWENRPLPFGLSIPDPNDPTEFINVNVRGMDALHMGLEIDFAYKIVKQLTFEGMISIGDWTWQSTEKVAVMGDTITFYAKGVHVGDAAQSSYAASLRYAFVKNAYFTLKYTYFDRYYSNFDPVSLTKPDASLYDVPVDQVPFDELRGRDSWRIPGYGILSAHAGYRLKFEKIALNFKANAFNILNTKYISDATNNYNSNTGDDFNANSATVFIGQGFRFNVALGFEF